MDLRSKGERVLVEVAVGMHLSLGFRLTSNRKTNIESTRYHTPPHKSVQDEKHAIPEKKWCRFFLKHSLGSKEERNNHHVLPPRPAQLYLISETFEDRSDDQLLSSRIPLSPPPILTTEIKRGNAGRQSAGSHSRWTRCCHEGRREE